MSTDTTEETIFYYSVIYISFTTQLQTLIRRWEVNPNYMYSTFVDDNRLSILSLRLCACVQVCRCAAWRARCVSGPLWPRTVISDQCGPDPDRAVQRRHQPSQRASSSSVGWCVYTVAQPQRSWRVVNTASYITRLLLGVEHQVHAAGVLLYL